MENNIFIAEGEKTFAKLLQSNIDIHSIFALPEYYEQYSQMIESKSVPENSQYTAPREIMQKIVGFRLHAGVMAIGHIPQPLPPDRIETPALIMNGIIDSENVGAIVRNCAAFGVGSIIYDRATSTPWLRRAVRVSMGAVFDMEITMAEQLSDTFNILREKGIEIIAAETCDGSIPLENFDFPEKFALIVGSEGAGIDKEILSQCDRILHIPISDKIPSINVAAATAVILQKARLSV
jgi:tRNA G18 (ribose-2'-O)-methylase SpoU